ncbi:MAG: hypothetical protein J6S21_03770 [Victivallales bacterium]|nr:hypothetical protein [Victivallales bacterium]
MKKVLFLILLASTMLTFGASTQCAQDGKSVMPPPPHHRHLREGDKPAPGKPGKPGKPGMPPPVRRFFDKLQKENPAEYNRLQKLRREDRRAFMNELAKLRVFENDMNDSLHTIEKKCWELAAAIRNEKDPAAQSKLREDLRKTLEESCDAMVKHTRNRIEMMEKRLQYIEQNREQILDQRMKFFCEEK